MFWLRNETINIQLHTRIWRPGIYCIFCNFHAVYFYFQRIYAAQLPNSADWTTFGYSLSGGMDLDDNTYPDVLVGSYEVDKVALLRTRPIIYLHSNITVRPDKLNMSANTEKRCEYDGTAWYCVQIKLCLRYTAEPAER